MNKKIEFNYEGVDYTLEYNREAVEFMENNGLRIKEIQEKPLTMVGILWKGAFYKNHSKEKLDKVQEIYDNIPNKSDLNAALTNMFYETYAVLIGDSDEKENNSKNIEWKMS